jgi:hypothetical protein
LRPAARTFPWRCRKSLHARMQWRVFYVFGDQTRRCRAARVDCRMPLGAAELEVDKLEGSKAQVGARMVLHRMQCHWSPRDQVDINRRRPPRVHRLRKSSGAKGRRLQGPNFSFLSSSGATRAVCGFGTGSGRTRECWKPVCYSGGPAFKLQDEGLRGAVLLIECGGRSPGGRAVCCTNASVAEEIDRNKEAEVGGVRVLP